VVDVWVQACEILSRLQGMFARSGTPQKLHYSGCMEEVSIFVYTHLGFHRWKLRSS